MFRELEGSGGNVLAVEISGGYKKEDVAQFKKAWEGLLAQGHAKINLLVKIDQLEMHKSDFSAFVEDARYALRFIGTMGHIAVVGHSAVQKALITLDNKFFGDTAEGLEERYFDIAEMDKAWAFVKK